MEGIYLSLSTKDRIIEATVELVNEKGYKGATTKEIAERAGVNEVTLFRHFGNKKGIVEAVIQKYGSIDLLENTFVFGKLKVHNLAANLYTITLPIIPLILF